MIGLLLGGSGQKAFRRASHRDLAKLHKYFSASSTDFTQEQHFVGGYDDVRMPSSPIVSRGQHLLQNWNDQQALPAVGQNQIRSLIKVNYCFVINSHATEIHVHVH